MKRFTGILIVLVGLLPAMLFAQSQEELTSDVIKAEKKRIVGANVQLTEEEQKEFWPLYDAYQTELSELEDKKIALIKMYAEHYQDMTDEKAQELLDQFLAVDDEALEARRTHVKKFLKALPAKRVARYFQVENKLDAIVNYDLARGIPLVK
jgi:hypothetical protein